LQIVFKLNIEYFKRRTLFVVNWCTPSFRLDRNIVFILQVFATTVPCVRM
jgi:hypothetical protein